MSLDSLAFNLLGTTENLFFKLEGDDSTVAEAEVTVSVKSSDEQMDDLAADTAASEVTDITNEASEMLSTINNLFSLTSVLSAGDLSADLYAFVNGEGQLDKSFGITLPAKESLDATGNKEIATRLVTSFESRIAQFDATGKSNQCFAHLAKSIAKFGDTFSKCGATRRANLAALVAKLEAEEATAHVEVSVSEPSSDPEVVDTTVVTTPEPTEETPEVTTEVETTADVAEPTEVEEAVEALRITSLDVTPIMTALDKVGAGDMSALTAIKKFNNEVVAANRKLRSKMSTPRKITMTKQSIIDVCKSYMKTLDESDNIGKLFHAAHAAAMAGTKSSVKNAEEFVKTRGLLLAAGEASTYLVRAKKIMDTAYYNLKFLASKAIVKNSINKKAGK